MLTDDKKHIIIEYQKNSKKQRIGVVVATAAGIVGWSLCNKRDKFDKLKGLKIAQSRAQKIASLSELERAEFLFEKLPDSLTDLFLKVRERSFLYFKSAE